jgi:hypothetical protein
LELFPVGIFYSGVQIPLGFLKMIIYISVMDPTILETEDFLEFVDYFFSLQKLKWILKLRSCTKTAKSYFQFNYFYF